MELIITVFVYNFNREKMRNNLVRVAVEITLDKEEQDKLEKIVRSSLSPVRRCQPWRAKRRLVVPSSREAALLTRRAHSARGEAK